MYRKHDYTEFAAKEQTSDLFKWFEAKQSEEGWQWVNSGCLGGGSGRLY